jgi:hypothetical protein
MHRLLWFSLLVALLTVSAFAADIVTMPTANQLKKGEVDVAVYYLDLDLPPVAPQNVNYQTLYVGITDRIELDVHRADVDKDKTSVVLVGSYKLLSETNTLPDLVIGVRNFTGEETTNNPVLAERSGDPSFFLSAAKTFFLRPQAPGPPLVRAHLSLGTGDWTLLGEERHKGLFGGVQFLVLPWLGGVVQYDGADTITAVTIMPLNTGLTIKGGTYGDHTWIGLSYQRKLF